MTYEPFALKYRPRVFRDVVGQRAVAETLRNALTRDRVANAFLFCGSRGVGKTSMARILAKALNCASDAREGPEPCGVCDTCEAIAKGDDLDVIEIDGASNRGIDEIRAIRDNVGYTPSRGRFKVYIIDEVHMLTMQAFNALLKTLEEPPGHVKFVFATTEARSVPDTIVSRCQRFEFRRIAIDDITERLRFICEQEKLEAEDALLAEVARHGEGGLRDSLGLLDQLVAYAGDKLPLSAVDRVLGRLDSDVLAAVLEPAIAGDPAALLNGLDVAFDSGRDADEILEQSCETLRGVARRIARDRASDPGGGSGRDALEQRLSAALDLDRALLALRLLLNARREIKLVGEGRLQLELGLLRIARSKDLLPVDQILQHLKRGGGGGGDAGGAPPPRRRSSPPPEDAPPAGPRPRPRAPARGGEDSGWVPRGPGSSRGGGRAGPSSSRSEATTQAVQSEAPPTPVPALSEPDPKHEADAPRASAERPAAASPPPAKPAPASDPGAEAPPLVDQLAPIDQAPAADAAAPEPGAAFDLKAVAATFGKMVRELREKKPRLAASLERGEVVGFEDDLIEVELPAGWEYQRDQIEGAHRTPLEKALTKRLGRPVRLAFRLRSSDEEARRPATRRLYDDPMIRKIIETFGGGVVSVQEED